MGKRRIVVQGDDRLSKRCRQVTDFNRRLHILLDDMKETLEEAQGAGLAAPQVGILRRAVIVVDDSEEMLELVNPEILDQSGEQTAPEGCLSVPGKPYYAKIRAQDRDGNWFLLEREGLTARCLFHEIEHLDGHLYVEHIDHFMTDEELEEYYAEEEGR